MQVWACTCVNSPTPTEAWRRATLAFLGHVEESSFTVKQTEMGPIREQRVVLRVVEAFKGVKPGETVEHRLLMICTPEFENGQSVLLLLERLKGVDGFSEIRCASPRIMPWVADEMLFLRALPGSARRTRISGQVTSVVDLATGAMRDHLSSAPGFRVTVRSAERSATVTTNRDGVYEVYDLPPGPYVIEVATPPHLVASSDDPHRREAIVVLRLNGSATADFRLGPAPGPEH